MCYNKNGDDMSGFIKQLTIGLYTNPIILGLIVLGILYIVFGNKLIGWFGEHWTRKALKNLPKEYIMFNNVFIYVDNNTHEIDHVIVSPYGIFCIETKQYNGYFTGDKYDKKWVRHVGRKKYYYNNPIRQNYGHVKSLSKLLSIGEDKIYNVVCIPSRAKLKINHDGELVGYYDIKEKILSYKDIVIDNVEELVDIINRSNIKDKNIKKEHIKRIREERADDFNKCPKCGSKLVQREGKYGSFMGCSNYPRCKYTKKY